MIGHMSATDDIPHGWSGDRVRRFIVTGVVIGALLGLAVFLIKVAVVDDFAYGENWLWIVAVLVGALGGGVLGLISAGLGGSDQTDQS
jgi:hypothetical protein